MPLRFKTFPIRFTGGVETKEDEQSVLPSKLLVLENGVFTKSVSISKRCGSEALTTIVAAAGAPVSGGGGGRVGGASAVIATKTLTADPGVALATRDAAELILFTATRGYSYSDIGAWIDSGAVQSVGLSVESAVKSTAEQSAADYGEAGGIGVYAWEETGTGVVYAIVDATTGKVIVRKTVLSSNASRPRVIGVGSSIHIYYYRSSPTSGLMVAVVSAADPLATLSSAYLTTDIDPGHPGFDVAYWESATASGRVALAWCHSSTQICLGFVHPSGALGGPLLGYPSRVFISSAGGKTITAGPAISVDDSDVDRQITLAYQQVHTGGVGATTYWSIWHPTQVSGVDVIASIASGSLSASTSFEALTCRNLGESIDNARRTVIFRYDSATKTVYYDWCDDSGADSSSATTRAVDVELASHAFCDTGRGDGIYLHLKHSSTYYNTYLTMRHDGLVVARYLSGVAGDTPTSDWRPKPLETGRKAIWAALAVQAIDTEASEVYGEQGIALVTLDFGKAGLHRTAQLGRTLYMAGGGMLQAYDGDSFVEHGGHWAIDDVPAPTQSAASGALVPGAVHIYRFVVEYVLSNGEVVRGPVSIGTTVTIGGGKDTLTFAIPTIRITQMTAPRGNIRIGVYRSENGGAVLYRVSSLDPNASGANGYVENASWSASAAFVDKMSDATLVAQEPLYTNGGILENDPTPCGDIVVAGRNRLFFTDPQDPLLVRYSQVRAEGYAVETSPLLSVALDQVGGPITALCVMDDIVFCFKATAIFAFGGPGLAADGQQQGFSEPQLIPGGVGARDPRTVALTPLGIVFVSEKGIHLLDRGRTVRYIGAPVEAFNSQTFVSAKVFEDRTQVRFLTSEGETLVWDYLFDQWSTFTQLEGVDAVLVEGVYHYLADNGRVFRESPSSYADGGNRAIPFAFETAWIKVRNQISGFQEILNLLIVGRYFSPHILRVRIAYDYEPDWYTYWDCNPAETYDADVYGAGNYGDGPYGGEGEQRYHFKLHVAEECAAFKLRFEFRDDSYGACAEITELLVEAGLTRTGRYPMPDTRSY